MQPKSAEIPEHKIEVKETKLEAQEPKKLTTHEKAANLAELIIAKGNQDAFFPKRTYDKVCYLASQTSFESDTPKRKDVKQIPNAKYIGRENGINIVTYPADPKSLIFYPASGPFVLLQFEKPVNYIGIHTSEEYVLILHEDRITILDKNGQINEALSGKILTTFTPYYDNNQAKYALAYSTFNTIGLFINTQFYFIDLDTNQIIQTQLPSRDFKMIENLLENTQWLKSNSDHNGWLSAVKNAKTSNTTLSIIKNECTYADNNEDTKKTFDAISNYWHMKDVTNIRALNKNSFIVVSEYGKKVTIVTRNGDKLSENILDWSVDPATLVVLDSGTFYALSGRNLRVYDPNGTLLFNMTASFNVKQILFDEDMNYFKFIGENEYEIRNKEGEKLIDQVSAELYFQDLTPSAPEKEKEETAPIIIITQPSAEQPDISSNQNKWWQRLLRLSGGKS